MTEPTALQSLEVLHKIVEAVQMTGPERDGARFHAQNISKALQPKVEPQGEPTAPAEVPSA